MNFDKLVLISKNFENVSITKCKKVLLNMNGIKLNNNT